MSRCRNGFLSDRGNGIGVEDGGNESAWKFMGFCLIIGMGDQTGFGNE